MSALLAHALQISFLMFVLSAISLANTPFEKIKSASAKLPQNQRPNERALKSIKKYLKGASGSRHKRLNLDKAVALLCEDGADESSLALERELSSIVVDGRPNDWLSTSFVDEDNLEDTRPIKKEKPSGQADGCDDLSRFGFAQSEKDLFLFFEPKALPKSKAQFHYRINFINDKGRIVFAVLWTSKGNFIQQWNVDDGSFLRHVPLAEAHFAVGTVYEARVPKVLLPALPQKYLVQAVVWHEFKNRLDALNGTFRLPPGKECCKHSLALFCRYAEKGYLDGDLDLLAQAIVDGHLYGMAENEKLKERIVRDGFEFQQELDKGHRLYPEKLCLPKGEYDLACQLVLASRQGIYGGYNDFGYPLAVNGKLTQEAYEFMIMQPRTLPLCRQLLKKNELVVKGHLLKTINNIERWLSEVIKYRRYRCADIEELARYNPKSPKWQRLAKTVRLEEKHNRQYITKVGAHKIHKGVNWSATFQVNFLLRNNFFYGNCVDVTTVALAIHKAMGVPSLHICFGPISLGHYREQHSFPMWFSHEDERWYSFNRQGNVPAKWMERAGRKNDVYFYINGPQMGSRWSSYKIKEQRNQIGTNNRALRFVVSKKRWTDIQKAGLVHSLFTRRLGL